ncbi:MAG: methionyl-tRNA formyltransferase [Cytophagales bacterium]|nr:methionyl-tRNA formyltransferase [Cytophagales bacterium]
MGTPDFAVPSLRALVVAGFPVLAVITAPDKPKGRGLQPASSPVKQYAASVGLPVWQPANLKDPVFQAELAALGADLQVVVAFRMLPEAVWAMPAFGTFNLHASLLPQYRGAAPINWAVMNGETETGLTTFFLQHEIDTGSIIFQEKEPIHWDDTAGSLYERLMIKGANLVLQTAQAVEHGQVPSQAQTAMPGLKAAPKIFKETCQIDWGRPARELYHFVRGLAPYPTAWTQLEGKVLKVYWAQALDQDHSLSPGQWRSDGATYLHFATGAGWLELKDVQMEGKKRMDIQSFLRGYKLPK